MKLGIFIGKEEYKAVIMDVPVKDGVIYSLSSKDLSKVKEFILPYKKNISSAGIFISDYYTEYFINEFKGAKDEDLPKLIKFKVKELSLYKEAVSVLGFQAINKVENLIKTVSAVTKGEVVKQAEELVEGLGIKDFTITASSFPLLNLCKTGNFSLICSMDNTLTVFFGNQQELTYVRKLKVGENSVFGIPATFKYYRENFKDNIPDSVFTIGKNIELPEGIKEKTITINTLAKTKDNMKLDGFEIPIGGLLNL